MITRFRQQFAAVGRFAISAVAGLLLVTLSQQPLHGGVFLIGDYNGDGIVSHADYSVLGDAFGQVGFGGADGDFNGIVDLNDFEVYRVSYGQLALPPDDLFLSVTAVPVAGNLQWTLSFAPLTGALAAHLNISTSGPNILSAEGGGGYLDDGDATLETPGINSLGSVEAGISVAGNKAFAALGTTLGGGPLPPGVTPEFLTLITAGTGPTTLTLVGEAGYHGLNYNVNVTATIPEPATWLMGIAAMAAVAIGRRSQNR